MTTLPNADCCKNEDNVYPSTDTIQNAIPYVTLQIALTIYIIVVLVLIIILYSIVHVRWWSSFVFSLVIGQIVLCVIYFPVYIDIWSEFNSYIGLYTFIQLITPVIVYIYALTMALSDT